MSNYEYKYYKYKALYLSLKKLQGGGVVFYINKNTIVTPIDNNGQIIGLRLKNNNQSITLNLNDSIIDSGQRGIIKQFISTAPTTTKAGVILPYQYSMFINDRWKSLHIGGMGTIRIEKISL